MDYEHHVFISYRHHESWPDWVEKLFMPPLRQWLGEEIGDDAAIFFDRNLETGTRWSPQIKRALARSRVLLPCFSRQYFTSEWCRLELALMLARERAIGMDPAYSLVVPIILHDGDDLPDLAAQLQSTKFLDVADPWIADRSPKMEALSTAVRELATAIRSAINRAPAFSADWEDLSAEAIAMQLATPEPKQTSVPSLGTQA